MQDSYYQEILHFHGHTSVLNYDSPDFSNAFCSMQAAETGIRVPDPPGQEKVPFPVFFPSRYLRCAAFFGGWLPKLPLILRWRLANISRTIRPGFLQL